jgi:hypothetical protein
MSKTVRACTGGGWGAGRVPARIGGNRMRKRYYLARHRNWLAGNYVVR